MKTVLRIMFALIIVLLAVGTVSAGGTFHKATIEGPGLSAPVTVRDEDMMLGFSHTWFNDYERQIPAPDLPMDQIGYTITRYAREHYAWDRVTYYPHPEGGQGIAFYDGMLNPMMGTQGQGLWYAVRPEGDAAMREILAKQGVFLPGAEKDTLGGGAAILWPVVGSSMLLLGLLGAWLAVSQRVNTLPTEAQPR